jgi:hypothetical protein
MSFVTDLALFKQNAFYCHQTNSMAQSQRRFVTSLF